MTNWRRRRNTGPKTARLETVKHVAQILAALGAFAVAAVTLWSKFG